MKSFKEYKYIIRCIDNERGVALILTLSMLVIMSLLGALALDTTNTELQITSNHRVASEAFVAAELAVEYAAQKALNDRVATDLSADMVLNAAMPDGAVLAGDGRNNIAAYTGTMPTAMMSGTSTDAYQGNIYRTGDHEDAEGSAAYYRVEVEATAHGRSSARIEKLFVNRAGHVF